MQFQFSIRNFLLAVVVSITFYGSTPLLSQDDFSNLKDWPAGVQSRGELNSARSYDYDFSDISVSTLQTWLGRVGIEIPVNLDGNLSGWIWVQRSADGWFDFSNYKMEGEINSPKLSIDQWRVKDARVRFGYAGGNWYVGKIGGEISSAGDASPIGIADGKARLLTASTSITEIAANVDSIDLQALLRSFGLDVELQNSGGSVLIAGSFPIAAAADLSTWTAKANVALDNITTPWIESDGKAFASLELRSGTWKFTDGRIKVAEQDLKITGTGKLSEDLPLEMSVTGDRIDVRQLLRQLKNPELAEQLDGSIQLVATAKANRAQGLERAVATIQSSSLDVRSQAIKNVNVVADYTLAGIKLEIAGADLAGGSITGAASWRDIAALEQGLPSAADLEMKSILLEKLVWVELPAEIAGTTSGSLSFEVENQDGLDDWSSTGDLEIDGLSVAGTGLGNATLTLEKVLSASELTGGIALKQGGGAVDSNVIFSLETPPESTVRATNLSRYRAEGELDNYDLVARIGNKNDGLIPITAFGSFNVSGAPGEWLEQGSASLSNSFAKLGDQLLRLELADVSFNRSEIRVERFRLLDSAGRVAGAASLRRDGVGEHLLRLRVVDTPLKPYLQRLAPGTLSSIAGVAAIELELKKSAESADLNRDWQGTTSGSLKSLVYRGKPIGDLNFKGEVRDHLVTAAIDGMVIGGEATGSLKLPFSIFEATEDPNATAASIDLKVANVQAKRLAGFLLEGKFAKDIIGSLSLEFNAQAKTYADPKLVGRINIPLLKQQNTTLVRDFSASLNYSDDRISIENLAGGLAGGRIDAQGYVKLNFGNGSTVDSARVNFVTQRLDANHLVSLVSPEYAEYFSGAIDYRGIATYRRGFQLNGSAVVKNGNLFGIPIQVGRGGLRTELTPAGEFSRAVSRDLHGIGFGGRFQGKLDIRKETNYTLKTSGRIAQGKLQQLGRVLGFEKTVGSGTFNGSFDLESDQIELIRALNGGLQIKFENGDLNSIPLLSSIDRFVPLLQFASTDIENGRLDARLGQGQMRIMDLIVTSKAFLLAASGGVALDGSKLDLDVLVQTGGSVQQQLTQTAIERLLVSPIPQFAVINELNELIRNRSVFLHVGGRTSQPVIQAKPAQTAAKAFLQTLGRQAIGATPTANQ